MENAEADCRAVLKRLYVYLDREIEGEVCAEIDRHLERCRSCFEHLGFERELKILIKRKCSERAIPEGLAERVRDRLRGMI